MATKKIKFNDYTYYNVNHPDNDDKADTTYAFNKSTFNDYFTNRNYEGAADYLSNFWFDNPEEQQQHLQDIDNIRNQGRIYSAVYNKISKQNDKDAIEFIDNLYTPGGLDRISNNSAAKKYSDWLRNFGGENTNTLKVTFQPKKQYGLFGIDWLAADNDDYNIDVFYEKSGLSEAQLKASGVTIENKDGRTILTFNKSNDLTSQILMNIPIHSKYDQEYFEGVPTSGSTAYANFKAPNIDNSTMSSLTGSPNLGGFLYKIDPYSSSKDVVIEGVSDDQSTSNIPSGYWLSQLRYAQQDIEYLTQKKKDLFTEQGLETQQYSSVVMDYLDVNLENLKAMRDNGLITEAQYKNERKLYFGSIDTAVAGSGFSQIEEMYSNMNNEEVTDDTLRAIDAKDRSALQHMLSANLDELIYQVMSSNGKIGTLITLPAKETSDKEIQNNIDASLQDRLARKRIQVFIPNFVSNLEQTVVNKNTAFKARRELNNMINYNYEYKTSNDEAINADRNGNYYLTASDKSVSKISEEDAVTLINKDMSIREISRGLMYKHTNYNGQLIDYNDYVTEAKRHALAIVNELYPNVNILSTENGVVTDEDIEELFNKQSGSSNEVAENYARYMNYDVYMKYKQLFEIYNSITSPWTEYLNSNSN